MCVAVFVKKPAVMALLCQLLRFILFWRNLTFSHAPEQALFILRYMMRELAK